MLGAIIGDFVGSVHEWSGTKTKDFPLLVRSSRFTDDSLLTVAVAKCILEGSDYAPAFHSMVERYPGAGWGGRFRQWGLARNTAAYGSYGNGSAMRVSPIGFAFGTADETLREAERSAAVTHDHPEGIKGAQATALAVFLARHGADKQEVRRQISERFGYDLSRHLDDIRPTYAFDESCQGTVPQAITAFLESTDFEDAVRNAVSLGGDADTLAAITGAIAQAHYGAVPTPLREWVRWRLPHDLWEVVERFEHRFGIAV